MARRSLCNHVQAVSYFFRPSTRCSPKALAPFFCVVTHHLARNQTGKGVLVSWNIVPAVTEIWHPQLEHSNSLPRTGQNFSRPQRRHTNPSGQRSRVRYARHASSVAKLASNSAIVRGYSSMNPSPTYCGHFGGTCVKQIPISGNTRSNPENICSVLPCKSVASHPSVLESTPKSGC